MKIPYLCCRISFLLIEICHYVYLTFIVYKYFIRLKEGTNRLDRAVKSKGVYEETCLEFGLVRRRGCVKLDMTL